MLLAPSIARRRGEHIDAALAALISNQLARPPSVKNM
jgi:hypothetical protein